jgi:hypothetical protein
MDIKEIRRANMLKLVEHFGSLKRLAEATDTPAGYLSNIKIRARKGTKVRGMGDAVARRIESKLSLRVGWMDREHISPSAVVFARQEKLKRLINEHYQKDESKFAADHSFTPEQVGGWLELEGPGISDEDARLIERRIGLPFLALEHEALQGPPFKLIGGAAGSEQTKLRRFASFLETVSEFLTAQQKSEIDADVSHLIVKITQFLTQNVESGGDLTSAVETILRRTRDGPRDRD